jgi:hypothetical protein
MDNFTAQKFKCGEVVIYRPLKKCNGKITTEYRGDIYYPVYIIGRVLVGDEAIGYAIRGRGVEALRVYDQELSRALEPGKIKQK